MKELLEYIENDIIVTDAIQKKLNSIVVKRAVQKGESVLPQDSLKKQHIFVISGCLRSFYRLENGKEVTIQFAIKNWWIGDYITLFTENKSILAIEGLTKSEILLVDKHAMEQLYFEHPEFEIFQRKNFEKHIATLQKRILGLLTQTASEKYNQFISDYTHFVQKIPNYQIASYLGITAESLSRIRKNNRNTR